MRLGFLIAGGLAVLVAAILLFRSVQPSPHTEAAARPSVVSPPRSPAMASPPSATDVLSARDGMPSDPSVVHGVSGERTVTQAVPSVPSAERQAGVPKPIIGQAEERANRERWQAARKQEKQAWKVARAKDPTLKHSEFRRAWLEKQQDEQPK